MGILDRELPLPCPGCGATTVKTWAWLKEEPESFECSGCGKTVVLNDAQKAELADSLKAVEQAVENLKQTFDRLSH